MNEGALHQQRFEAIEAYLLGTMPAGVRAAFEAELAHDTRLGAEVALQRENMLAVELGGLQRTMRSIAGEEAPATSTSRSAWTGYLKYAAAVALIVSVAVWWWVRPSEEERLFAAHFTADPGLPVPMSISSDPVFHDAMVAYKLGDFDEARSKWATLVVDRPTNDTLRYYMGTAALAGGNATEAIPLLRMVADDTVSGFSTKARWYLFLSYLRTGDQERMATVDLDHHPVYGERVRAIKQSLQ